MIIFMNYTHNSPLTDAAAPQPAGPRVLNEKQTGTLEQCIITRLAVGVDVRKTMYPHPKFREVPAMLPLPLPLPRVASI
ncbi:hypothetical protein EVAR_66573_1 [Eumeta japonica]|uniref:Uncharacterized protein n=1 Tax=Eumeta variegata TaxID=151549 RepID=A0A4C1Z8B9_EUMVA|nr:hypothetical protein EVAR_66573_1 [Eumeta japonica]